MFELSTYLKNWRHPQTNEGLGCLSKSTKITLGNPKESKEVGEWMEKQLFKQTIAQSFGKLGSKIWPKTFHPNAQNMTLNITRHWMKV